MEWSSGAFTITTNKDRLDIEVIHGFLKTSYWAADRSREAIEATIANSVCFGVLTESRQIGFARLVSDGVVISWLGDVFIIPEFQGRGLGKWLMSCVVAHPLLQNTKCILGTNDAHGLYEKFGFERKELMRREPGGDSFV